MIDLAKGMNRERLIGLAIALGAKSVSGWSDAEEKLALEAIPPSAAQIGEAQNLIVENLDVLGEIFSNIYSPEQRRPFGAVYTPSGIVDSMLRWSVGRSLPERVIDAGAGSARFLVSAGRTYKSSKLIGIEFDPLASILARAHISASGFSNRGKIICGDYRNAEIETIEGQTLFVGNPPYVRHHQIAPEWKKWLQESARKLNISVSGLAGLHAYFFLATAHFARAGDVGVFITSAEWLDVNYGGIIRDLFLTRLGGSNIHVIEPAALPFPGIATTGVVTGFTVGSKPKSILLQRVDTVAGLGALDSGHHIRRERLETAHRWTPLTHPQPDAREDFIELGELCKVHRGQVTGANQIWIADRLYAASLPQSVLFPSITRARELFASRGVLNDDSQLRRVIDIPSDLDILCQDEKRSVEDYLVYAKSRGAHIGYVASHRKKWWSVGLREPAPILATYMARRPPTFVRNFAAARHINVAHGLYPREMISEKILTSLAEFLSRNVSVTQGRTYAGGPHKI